MWPCTCTRQIMVWQLHLHGNTLARELVKSSQSVPQGVMLSLYFLEFFDSRDGLSKIHFGLVMNFRQKSGIDKGEDRYIVKINAKGVLNTLSLLIMDNAEDKAKKVLLRFLEKVQRISVFKRKTLKL